MNIPIITISREYGSAGHIIGEKLAKSLGVPFYDKALILMAAKESGFSEEYIRRTEQVKSASFLYNLYMSTQILPISDQIFLVESKIIRELAEKEPCVIVGRCADFVLRGRNNCMNVFIHAPLEERVRRAKELYGDNVSNLDDYVRKQDKRRASYYNYFSQNKWGDSRHYHLTISSSFGINKTVQILRNAALAFGEGEE